MTEVVIIVALIAIGAIGITGLFGNDIRALFGASSESLAGQTSVDNGGSQRQSSLESKTLATFGNNDPGGGQMHGN